MRSNPLLAAVWPFAGAVILSACAAGEPPSGFEHGSSSGTNHGSSSGGSGGSGSSGGSGGSGSSGGLLGSSGSSSSGGGSSGGGDGGIGIIDQSPPCDSSLAVDGDAFNFAKAMGICTSATQSGYGIVSASYSNGFGTSAQPVYGQWGLLPAFGVLAPREGSSIGALSSGFARAYDDAAGVDMGMNSAFVAGQPMAGTAYPTGVAPSGYPQAAQGCPQDNKVNDMIDLKLVLKAPPEATGFQFDFAFFSSEWPNYVCSNFNDAFVAYLTSQQTTGNISFDSKNNPVAVNIGFLDVCTAGAPIGCLRSNGAMPDPPMSDALCPSGTAQLQGTGYAYTDQTQCDPSVNNVSATLGASTGWLTTKAPITAGEQFTLDLMIWDAGDGLLDSSVLIDHFQWIGGEPVTTVTMPAPAQ